MFSSFWNNFFYEPLYNLLVFLVSVIPGGDVGLAVILLTVIVKLILFPLSQKSVSTQAKLRGLEGEISSIKNKHKDNKEALARATMDVYKREGVNPFSGCLPILIQFPIIIALYFVFLKEIHVSEGVLYSFLSFPEIINPLFLGFLDIGSKSLVLAILVALSQYFQVLFAMPKPTPRKEGEVSFADEFARSMNTQMRYVLPVIIGFVVYSTSVAIGLYFLTSNLFSIGQEFLVRRKTNNPSGK